METLLRRPDGSFLTNNGTYHVPNQDEWVDKWAELTAYAQAHPEYVTDVDFAYGAPPSFNGLMNTQE